MITILFCRVVFDLNMMLSRLMSGFVERVINSPHDNDDDNRYSPEVRAFLSWSWSGSWH